MTLDEALGKLAEGNDAAFDKIYEETRRTVYYIALSVVRERMLAEDVMQTTYLKVLGNASRYRRGTNAAAWIARIARNEALDLMRRRSREYSVDERENPLPFGTRDVDDYGLLIDLARRILKREEFSVLMLAVAEGYKRREIAELLGMPLPTVTWHYTRAVRKMQAALAEEREPARGGGVVDRRELETELRREAQEHTPDVYTRIRSAQPIRAEGDVLVRTRRKPFLVLACAVAAVLVALACILPFALQKGTPAVGGNGNLYISINPSVEFTVQDNKVTGVRALNRDAALLLVGEDFVGMTPEDAGAAFAELSDQKHLITAQGIGVYATGADGAAIEQRVRERLTGQYGGTYAISELSKTDFDALLAAYDATAMGDFEDYLERELSYLSAEFAQKVRELTGTYLADLDSVFAGSMTQADFNTKYLYLGEDCIFEDGDESRRDLEEEFAELCRDIERYGDDYIFDELFDEFLDEIEDLYETEDEDDDDDDDDDDEHDRDDERDDRDDRDDRRKKA